MEISSEMWDEFIQFKNACQKNRAFPECTFISRLINTLPELAIDIEPASQFYRARIFKNSFPDELYRYAKNAFMDFEHGEQHLKRMKDAVEKNKKQVEAGFKGYDEQGSFICPDVRAIDSGRCNYANEQCLYLSEDIQTAISEMKPLIREEISVACIQSLEPLKVVDFSLDNADIPIKELVAFLFVTSPTFAEYDIYTYTQIICSIAKRHGYDGIKFSSCQALKKSNYAIFNYNKCKAISSNVYYVDSIDYHYSAKSEVDC